MVPYVLLVTDDLTRQSVTVEQSAYQIEDGKVLIDVRDVLTPNADARAYAAILLRMYETREQAAGRSFTVPVWRAATQAEWDAWIAIPKNRAKVDGTPAPTDAAASATTDLSGRRAAKAPTPITE